MLSLDLFSRYFEVILRTDIKELFLMAFSLTELPITSGVPQGSILGLLMFIVYVNDSQNYIHSQSTNAPFADDSKVYKSIDFPDSSKHLQIDLDSLYKWSLDWTIEFNKPKCQVPWISRKKDKSWGSVPEALKLHDRKLAKLLTKSRTDSTASQERHNRDYKI